MLAIALRAIGNVYNAVCVNEIVGNRFRSIFFSLFLIRIYRMSHNSQILS